MVTISDAHSPRVVAAEILAALDTAVKAQSPSIGLEEARERVEHDQQPVPRRLPAHRLGLDGSRRPRVSIFAKSDARALTCQ
jgi:hypothetical protein